MVEMRWVVYFAIPDDEPDRMTHIETKAKLYGFSFTKEHANGLLTLQAETNDYGAATNFKISVEPAAANVIIVGKTAEQDYAKAADETEQ
jgi:hypothetical protein